MASTALGDIPDARHSLGVHAIAAVASGGANAKAAYFGPFEHPVRIRALYYTPTAADQGANTASYRRLTVVNAGAAGTGTTVIGSLNLSVSKASLAPASFVVDSTATVAAGAQFVVSQITVGGAETTGTVLQAGYVSGSFEVI